MAMLQQFKSRFVSPNAPLGMGRSRHTASGGRSLSRLAKTVVGAMAGTVAIATFSMMSTALPGFAADPFRTENPHSIDDQTEQAFEAMFRDGDYVEAQELLETADADEPLAHAMSAAFSYLDEDWDALKSQYERTLQAAEQLESSDPLRSHLYSAVGYFMEGGHIFSTESTLTAIPKVLNKLSQVLNNVKAAQAIDDTDPELNLIKGYMDLLIAVNLPSSDPETAIARMEAYAAPDYLVKRGVAIAYRDLKDHDNALENVDAAIAITPQNPDLYYLKGQILRNKAEDLDEPDQAEEQAEVLEASVRSFNRAFRGHEQMPPQLAKALAYERCRAQDRWRGRDRNCRDVAAEALRADDNMNASDTPEPVSP